MKIILQKQSPPLPAIIHKAGDKAARRFVEFFTANIRNKNTRLAYARAIAKFLHWCDERGLELDDIEPITVAAYIEGHPGSKKTIKQHLAALRMMFNWLVTGQILLTNPAHAVRGPKYSERRGKTPALSAEEAKHLLDSIPTNTAMDLRDRAIIGTMVFSFARVSAVAGMSVRDVFKETGNWMFRFLEKGGKQHVVPVHPKALALIQTYLPLIAGSDSIGTLFRSANAQGKLTNRAMTRIDIFRMIKRRARKAGLSETVCCHTFRATGITTYLKNGGSMEKAQIIANHASPRTTKLYDRTNDDISMTEIEKIAI